jgi:hypothetical protein
VATDGQDGRVLDAAFAVDGDVRRAAPDVDVGHPEFLLVGR